MVFQKCAECGKGFYRKDHLRKHIKSHQSKRAKEVANGSGSSLNTTDLIIAAVSNGGDSTIKRERPSPIASPQEEITMPQLSQEVTIHVSRILLKKYEIK